MTTAEMLRAEGRAEGRLEGEAAGLIRLLQAKFGDASAAVHDMIRRASIVQIREWTVALLSANTLDELGIR
ncbi:DUF4351 domain-containing protein [Nocardia camponoti]|uniref:DUF4351 domain-containing protein n=1 Tax=Nocardia camponoti TaxID=1616106 RepID=UPI001669AEB2|nr:DUF4351 domain-containing protein [Nocardia camponoti]